MLDHSLNFLSFWSIKNCWNILFSVPKISFIDTSMAYSMMICLPYIFHASWLSILERRSCSRSCCHLWLTSPFYEIIPESRFGSELLNAFLYTGADDCRALLQLTTNTHTHQSWYLCLWAGCYLCLVGQQNELVLRTLFDTI